MTAALHVVHQPLLLCAQLLVTRLVRFRVRVRDRVRVRVRDRVRVRVRVVLIYI